MDWGSTCSGVPIHRRMAGVNSTPRTVRAMPEQIPSATSVWMAFRIAKLMDALLEHYRENRDRPFDYTYGFFDAVGVIRELLENESD